MQKIKWSLSGLVKMLKKQNYEVYVLVRWMHITIWPEILAERYFGRLLKICHLAEFALAVKTVLAIMIFIEKWIIECAVNLTGPWASFRSVRTKSTIKCNWKLTKSLLCLIWTVFIPLVFTATVYTSFGLPCSRWQTSQLFSFGVQNSLEKRCSHTQLLNSMQTIRLARLAAGLVHRLWFHNNDDITLWSFWQMKYWRIALKTANLPK